MVSVPILKIDLASNSADKNGFIAVNRIIAVRIPNHLKTWTERHVIIQPVMVIRFHHLFCIRLKRTGGFFILV